jgi:hypothetical protein
MRSPQRPKGPEYVRRFMRSDDTIVEVPVLGVHVTMIPIHEPARLILHR